MRHNQLDQPSATLSLKYYVYKVFLNVQSITFSISSTEPVMYRYRYQYGRHIQYIYCLAHDMTCTISTLKRNVNIFLVFTLYSTEVSLFFFRFHCYRASKYDFMMPYYNDAVSVKQRRAEPWYTSVTSYEQIYGIKGASRVLAKTYTTDLNDTEAVHPFAPRFCNVPC